MEYTQQQIEEAFEGIKEIKEIVDISTKLPLTLGGKFCEAKQNEWFEKNNIDINDFCGEIRISPKTIFGYENIYRAFIAVGGYSINDLVGISYPKLLKLKPVLFKSKKGELPELTVRKEIADEWIAKAKELSTTDFNIEFNQAFKHRKNPEECKHEKATPHAYLSCPECGEKIWIDPNTKEPIKHWHNQK